MFELNRTFEIAMVLFLSDKMCTYAHVIPLKEKQKEVEEEIKNIKTEGKAWKFINRMRRKKEGISEKIERR